MEPGSGRVCHGWKAGEDCGIDSVREKRIMERLGVEASRGIRALGDWPAGPRGREARLGPRHRGEASGAEQSWKRGEENKRGKERDDKWGWRVSGSRGMRATRDCERRQAGPACQGHGVHTGQMRGAGLRGTWR